MKFKVGDKVLINGDRQFGWNSNGDIHITIGKIGVVEYVSSSGSCQVVFDEGITRKRGWYYHKKCLTLTTDVRVIPDELFRM